MYFIYEHSRASNCNIKLILKLFQIIDVCGFTCVTNPIFYILCEREKERERGERVHAQARGRAEGVGVGAELISDHSPSLVR